MYEKIGAADIDGVFCITSESTVWDRPAFYTCHWPTKLRTRDVLYFFGVESIDELEVLRSLPGSYAVSAKGRYGVPAQYIDLIDGGRTKSIKTTERDYPRPKRVKQAEYHDGAWHVVRAGRWVKV